MQPLPLSGHEIVATLLRHVTEAETAGLSRGQAIALTSRRLRVSPWKVAALVSSTGKQAG